MILTQSNNSFNALRRFVRRSANLEKCELCSVELAYEHQHLIEPASRKLLCACDACTILFSNQEGKCKRVPRSIRFLKNFQMTDAQWESLLIPINMAFFFYSSPVGKIVAFYPSPAGPTESLLPLESWQEILEANPILKTMEADTESLLVNRIKQTDAQYFIVPIDKCYELTGLIRAHWRGLGGGTEVWKKIETFFAKLKEYADGSQNRLR
jgi:hypothetical protein